MSVQESLDSQFLIRLISISRFEHALVSQDGMARAAEHRLSLEVLVLEPGPTKSDLFENVYRLDFHEVDSVKVDLSRAFDEDNLEWDVDDVTLEALKGDRFQLKFENAQTEVIIQFRRVTKTLLSSKVGRA